MDNELKQEYDKNKKKKILFIIIPIIALIAIALAVALPLLLIKDEKNIVDLSFAQGNVFTIGQDKPSSFPMTMKAHLKSLLAI